MLGRKGKKTVKTRTNKDFGEGGCDYFELYRMNGIEIVMVRTREEAGFWNGGGKNCEKRKEEGTGWGVDL